MKMGNLKKAEEYFNHVLKKIEDYISPKNGGEGIVREMIEKVMKIQGTWD